MYSNDFFEIRQTSPTGNNLALQGWVSQINWVDFIDWFGSLKKKKNPFRNIKHYQPIPQITLRKIAELLLTDAPLGPNRKQLSIHKAVGNIVMHQRIFLMYNIDLHTVLSFAIQLPKSAYIIIIITGFTFYRTCL